MKNWYLAILCLYVSLFAAAQNSTGMPAGNIGIGTTTPATPLDVNGLSTFRDILTMDFGVTNRRVQLKSDGLYLSRLSDGGFVSTIKADGSMLFGTRDHYRFLSNSIEYMTLSSTGNLGIGIASPSAKLDVFLTGAVPPVMRIQDGDVTIPNYSGVGFNPVLTNKTIGQFTNYASASGGIQVAGFSSSANSRAALVLGYSGKTTVDMPVVNFAVRKHNGTTSYAPLAATEPAFEFTNDITPLLRIMGNGRVGINTTAPRSTLQLGDQFTMMMEDGNPFQEISVGMRD